MVGHCVGGSCCHQHHDDDDDAPSTTSATTPFTWNSPFVEWKLVHLTVDTPSDSNIEASAEAFVADKVLEAW